MNNNKDNSEGYGNRNERDHRINEIKSNMDKGVQNVKDFKAVIKNQHKQMHILNQNIKNQINNMLHKDNNINQNDIDQLVEYEINDLRKSTFEIELKESLIENKEQQSSNDNNNNSNLNNNNLRNKDNNEKASEKKDMSHLADKINNIFQGESNKQQLEKTISLQFDSEYESTNIHQHLNSNNNKQLQPSNNNDNNNPFINNNNKIPSHLYKQINPTELHIITLWAKKCNEKLSNALTFYSERDYNNAYISFKKLKIIYNKLLLNIQEKKDSLPPQFIFELTNKIKIRIKNIDKFIVQTYHSLCQQKYAYIKQQQQPKQLPQVNKHATPYNSKINIANQHINKNKPSSQKGIHSKEDDQMDMKIENEIMLSKPDVKFSDIVGMNDLKQIIYEIIIMPNVRPDLFTGLRQPQRGLLLFGPPGTGKTMIAKAIANECDSTFFNISASSLTSKWVGESEKTVRSLFKLAYKKQPSIIFIDEIDSVLSKRSDNDNEAAKRLKTEFLIQFDGLGSNSEAKLLVIAATNRPMDLDDALLRRLPKRVYCGPLDEEGRFHYVKKLLNKIDYQINDEEIKQIAKQTERYSNSDLLELCREAAYEPVREKTTEEILQIKKFRPLVFKDFQKAMTVIRGSVSNEVNTEMDKWNQMYGML